MFNLGVVFAFPFIIIQVLIPDQWKNMCWCFQHICVVLMLMLMFCTPFYHYNTLYRYVFIRAASWIGISLSLCVGSNLKNSTELRLGEYSVSLWYDFCLRFASYYCGRSSSSLLSLLRMRTLLLCSAWRGGFPWLGHQLLLVSKKVLKNELAINM